ncbi:Cytochrome b-c1 complex subunit 7 [Acipenser ruthenus]|uniref:Cytochrome b-c1 complex subunit 7 n=1 Tax=Acipenser ruthenus TaxID=7906 RepID=A0A444U002_ACIRT|nr:Cytochrome b-c1 complex subunit 7 [Acipenser ruthenus]
MMPFKTTCFHIKVKTNRKQQYQGVLLLTLNWLVSEEKALLNTLLSTVLLQSIVVYSKVLTCPNWNSTPMLLHLDFETDIKERLFFLKEVGVEENQGRFISKNPFILTESMEDLRDRCILGHKTSLNMSATGRLLSGLRKWYYNAAGFNKLGLMRDDTMYEDDDVKEALKRLPEPVYNDRMFRIKRALDLSMKQQVLPKDQWTKYEEDDNYLTPYVKEVVCEKKEMAEWNKK